jgi:amidase
MDELIWLDASGQAEAIRAGQVSAVELLEAHLRRIGDLNDDLRALVNLDRAGALAQARTIDQRRRADPGGLPPFAGVPLSVKDTDDVAGLPTTQSCELLANNVAETDGPVAARLRASGAAIVGKSHVPEFCSTLTSSRLFGICRNPWDLGRSAGGSSGGAAAALAAGLCAISHGTDGAGSVRAPASWCGLVGIKPTRGLVTFGPEEDPVCYASSVPGVLVRSVRDTAAMLDVLAPPGPWTPPRPRPYADEAQMRPDQLRVAVSTRFPMGAVDAEVAAAVRDAGRLVEALGHLVFEADPEWEVVLAAAGLPLAAPHIAKSVSLDQVDRLEPRNQAALRREAAMTVLDFYRLAESARAASRRFVAFWDDVDVLLTPTVGIVAPAADWAPWDQDVAAHLRTFMTLPNFAHPFNITGQPALSLPLGWSANGLPIGVQLAGRRLEEAVLLRLAAQIEAASPWLERITAAGRALKPQRTSRSA